MLFVVHALDKPDHGHVRDANREAHVEHVRNHPVVKLLQAGPLTKDDGSTPIGTVLIVDAPDREAADEFTANDPYAKAGLFASSNVTAWKKTVG